MAHKRLWVSKAGHSQFFFFVYPTGWMEGNALNSCSFSCYGIVSHSPGWFTKAQAGLLQWILSIWMPEWLKRNISSRLQQESAGNLPKCRAAWSPDHTEVFQQTSVENEYPCRATWPVTVWILCSSSGTGEYSIPSMASFSDLGLLVRLPVLHSF